MSCLFLDAGAACQPQLCSTERRLNQLNHPYSRAEAKSQTKRRGSRASAAATRRGKGGRHKEAPSRDALAALVQTAEPSNGSFLNCILLRL